MTSQSQPMFKLRQSVAVLYLYWVIPAVFVSFLVFGYNMYGLRQSEEFAENLDTGKRVVHQTQQALTCWIEDQISLGKIIAQDPRVVAACKHPTDVQVRAEAQHYLQGLAIQFPHYENIPLAIRLPEGHDFTVQVNQETKVIKNGNFFIDTVRGATIGKCGPQFPYIRQVFAGQPYFISDVYPSILRGKPIFVIATPITDDGKILGAVIQSPQMDYFTEYFIEHTRIGTTGYLVMCDDRGMPISHPQKDLILNPEAQIAFEPIVKRILAGQHSFRAYFDGKEKTYVVGKLSADHFQLQNEWFIVFARDVTEVAQQGDNFLQKVVLYILGIGALLALIIYLLTVKLITEPLQTLTEATQCVAAGDLTHPIPGTGRRDEIGALQESIQNMTDSIRRQTKEISSAVSVLHSSADDIVSISRAQETIVEAHESSIIQVAASIKEINSTTKELAQTMNGIQNVSNSTQKIADAGIAGLGSMRESMQQLSQATSLINNRLAEINKKSTLINGIVTTINKVADQTNLLSLNASIEAEKTEQAGQGFAVIAREIRILADQTATATLDIEEMIKEMRQSVISGVDEMQAFSAEVSRDVRLVENVSTQLASIISQVNELAPQFAMVNQVMSAQADGGSHITQTMEQLSFGATNTAESLAQLNHSAQQLRIQAQNLQAQIARFKI